MKAFTKTIFNWIASLFNFGLYQLNDGMDSLVLSMMKNGVEQQANELIHLYQLVEYQQEILIILDVFKCLFMFISILFLFIVNQPRICSFFLKGYAKIKAFYQKLTKKKPVA
jgi:hypothetical protein